jgi:hypothetical protein
MRVASLVVVGLLSLAVSAVFSWVRTPLPRVHDEFSYLLAADTFASGRLSNPSHACWEHFETFHVLQTPRYASKYPPAQGLFLAFGQVVTGRPIVGAWFGVALGSVAVCWMLQAWTRPRWALIGGLLTAVHPGIHGGVDATTALFSWSQSYWGGGPAMIGGALLLGSLPRLARRPAARTSLLLALGVVLLANARPFEGLLVTVPAAVALASFWYRSGSFSVGMLARRVAFPVALVLIPGVAAMALYNRAVTGSALRMPYSVYEATYNPVPIFTAWRRPGPTPSYRHAVLKGFFSDWVLDQWSSQQSLGGWWRYHWKQWREWLWPFFVGPLVLPFLAIPTILGRRGNAFLAAECLIVVGAHLTTVGIQPHYAAPVFGAFMVLIVEGMRRIDLIRVGRTRIGRGLVGLTLVMFVVNLCVVAHTRATAAPGWEAERARIEASLASAGGRHLIVVRYSPSHDPLKEWVYNRAKIDSAAVVWAREMDLVRMEALLAAFRDRSVWLLEADRSPQSLSTYRGISTNGTKTGEL